MTVIRLSDHQTDQPAVARRNLPEEFWRERATLTHIRQAAHSRRLSGDAVLAVVLARVAAYTPHTVQLPGIVGASAPLNTGTSIVGPSGAGKSTAHTTGTELVRKPIGLDIADRPVGTGEGIAEAYYGLIKDPATGEEVRGVARHHSYVWADEGEQLVALMTRSGSTLAQTIRTAWSGGLLGQANADSTRVRIVPAGTYRWVMVLGFQRETAGALLDDATGGTPQRFVWWAAEDPSIPTERPAWPGPLPWGPPSNLERYEVIDRDYRRHNMGLADAIIDEIDAAQLARGRGEATGPFDPLDSHRHLVTLKVAACLALLERRMDVTVDDWALAGTVWTTSCAVRTDVKRAVAAVAETEETNRVRRHVRQETAAEAARAGATMQVANYAKRLGRFVQRQEPGAEFTRRDLRGRLAGQERDLFDQALATALHEKWLSETAGGYTAGSRKVA